MPDYSIQEIKERRQMLNLRINFKHLFTHCTCRFAKYILIAYAVKINTRKKILFKATVEISYQSKI